MIETPYWDFSINDWKSIWLKIWPHTSCKTTFQCKWFKDIMESLSVSAVTQNRKRSSIVYIFTIINLRVTLFIRSDDFWPLVIGVRGRNSQRDSEILGDKPVSTLFRRVLSHLDGTLRDRILLFDPTLNPFDLLSDIFVYKKDGGYRVNE